MRKPKKLSKFDKQFREIKSKGINISKKLFRQYYVDIRRVNRKLRSKSYKNKALDKRTWSYNVGHITSAKMIKARLRTFEKQLSRDYVKQHNAEIRKTLGDRFMDIFDKGIAKELKRKFAQLSDNELLEFMQENPDINQLQYLYDEKLANFISLIGLTAEKITGRLTYKFKEIKFKR